MRHYYTYFVKVREIEIPDRNLIGAFGPLEVPNVDRDRILKEAFNQPVNSPMLHEMVKPEDKVVIVTDDGLEPSPTVFPFFYVIQELHKAGVKDPNISVLIANGGHRPSTNAEVDRKIGAEMHRKYHVAQSGLNDRDQSWHKFGATHHADGQLDISADARLRDATFVIGICGTYPNRFKGFSGGASLLIPGLAHKDVASKVYLTGAEQPAGDVLGHVDTPARRLINQLTEMLPQFKFCVEMVIDKNLHLASCATGEPGSAFRVSADVAHRIYTIPVPERADVVVIDSHPFDMNLFQASHALYASLGALKPGGEIVLVSPLLENVKPHNAELASHLTETRSDLLKYSHHGYLAHAGATGAQLAAIREVLETASRVTVVSLGAGSTDVERFGFHRETNAQTAIDEAIARMGGNAARVTLITHGGLAVPRVNG